MCSHDGIELNLSKCFVITFSHKNINFNFDYNLLKYSVQHMSLVNDLGIYFDAKLKFNDNINKIQIKAASKLS